MIKASTSSITQEQHAPTTNAQYSAVSLQREKKSVVVQVSEEEETAKLAMQSKVQDYYSR